jgi:hypothetical protein
VKAAARQNLFQDLLQGNLNIDDLLHIDDVHTASSATSNSANANGNANGSANGSNTALSDSPTEQWSVTDATDKYAMYLHR